MPNSSHVWNAYSAPAVCWISKPKDSVASFSLYDPKDCVVRACGSLFSSIEQQHVLNWIHVFKEVFVCYGPGLRVLDADGLGLLPNTWLDCVFSGCESGHPCLQTLF